MKGACYLLVVAPIGSYDDISKKDLSYGDWIDIPNERRILINLGS